MGEALFNADALVDLIRKAVREELRADRESRSPELLSVDQAAQMAQAHPDTIRGWIKEGSLAASKPGKKWLIRSEDLAARLGRRPAEAEVNIAALAKEMVHRRRR